MLLFDDSLKQKLYVLTNIKNEQGENIGLPLYNYKYVARGSPIESYDKRVLIDYVQEDVSKKKLFISGSVESKSREEFFHTTVTVVDLKRGIIDSQGSYCTCEKHHHLADRGAVCRHLTTMMDVALYHGLVQGHLLRH